MVKHTFDDKAILDRNLALEAVRAKLAAKEEVQIYNMFNLQFKS